MGLALGAMAAGLGGAFSASAADRAVEVSGAYTADVIGAVSGDASHRGRVLDDLKIDAEIDLSKLAGWHGARARVFLLNNAGGTPNDDVGTLQGIDNIEVSSQRARLFEAWLEQDIGDKASVRVGLYDLNSEFYSSDAAGLLLAPAFGIGSELAATGPNGPSIFPSTALAARLRLQPRKDLYLEAAVLNAKAGVLGDPSGVDLSFGDGALGIGEVGWTGSGKLAIGGWTYTRRQDDLRAVDVFGQPARRRAAGAYLLVERPLWADEAGARSVTSFLRAGVSDGHTTPYRFGWQSGVLVAAPIASRPKSQFSVGVDQAYLTSKYRANLAALGQSTSTAETQFEITYADQIARLIVQPDLQYIINPGGDSTRPDAIVAGLRLSVEF